ncbi:hypothetical protein AV530_018876 [Patagioenas fasciata monilis]|uniref:Uncharacterized protein n=1 Tax=Patagioenas fasciata monilis TaxID=372326 RepID=A0A1V4JK23_PATFA|nr:hypothetical protein AV530_018876 [Patagioenas fasciata monilis]
MFVSCRFLLRQIIISCEMEQERPLHETMCSDPLEIMSCACEGCLQSEHQGWLRTSLTFKVTQGAQGEGGNHTRAAQVPGERALSHPSKTQQAPSSRSF